MSSKHHPHGEPVRWLTPNRRALETRRRELEDALLAEERRYADAHFTKGPPPDPEVWRDIVKRAFDTLRNE